MGLPGTIGLSALVVAGVVTLGTLITNGMHSPDSVVAEARPTPTASVSPVVPVVPAAPVAPRPAPSPSAVPTPSQVAPAPVAPPVVTPLPSRRPSAAPVVPVVPTPAPSVTPTPTPVPAPTPTPTPTPTPPAYVGDAHVVSVFDAAKLNVRFLDANTQRVIVRGLTDVATLGSCEATEGRRALTDLVKGQDVVLAIGGDVDRDATGTLVRDVSLNGVDVAASVLAEVAVACPADRSPEPGPGPAPVTPPVVDPPPMEGTPTVPAPVDPPPVDTPTVPAAVEPTTPAIENPAGGVLAPPADPLVPTAS